MTATGDFAGGFLQETRVTDDSARYTELARILEGALDLPTSERRAFLAGATNDAELAREAEQLLREEEALEGRFEPFQAEQDMGEIRSQDDSGTDDGSPRPGDQLGPFTLFKELGRGGMGAVYLAEQDEPIHRRVALKVIDRMLFDGQTSRRFEAEREALARLSHANIAALYEAGAAEDGTLFFAMELVEGEPITKYCDAARLDVRRRLLLLRSVCLGVAHAHQKGILHRDLKPSNVLVAESDGRAEPKIIDFGIAKALDRPLIEQTLETGSKVLGTPAFMSPESLGASEQVDTRSDVYALGVLLYELLVGTRPVGRANDNPVRLMRRIAQEDPLPLIERWQELSPEEQRAVAARRGSTPKRLQRLLQGDLGSVALRAVARRPEERYGSARELVADLERCLDDQPVTARVLTTSYELRKLMARHRSSVAAAILSVSALLLGSVGMTIGLVKARQAEQRAQAEARDALDARDETRETTVRLLMNLGASLGHQGRYAEARPLLEEALEILAGLGRADEAKADLERALALMPAESAQPGSTPSEDAEERAAILEALARLESPG